MRVTYGPAGDREPWHRLAVLLLMPLRLLFRLDFAAYERIPRRDGCIVVANHVSLFDPLPVALFVHRAGRRPRFMILASLFHRPALGTALRGLRQIPVDRHAADAARALDVAVDAVRRGECVVVYPEGALTRDADGWPMRGKTGVARLALATGAPVIPLAQWGPQHFLGRDNVPRVWRWARLRMRAGEPVDLSAWHGAEPGAEALRAMTDAVMDDLTDLVAALRTRPAPDPRTRHQPSRPVAR